MIIFKEETTMSNVNSMIYANLSQGKKGEAATTAFLESVGCTVTDYSNDYKAGYDLLAEKNGRKYTYEVKTMSKAALTNSFAFNLWDFYAHYELNDTNKTNALEHHDRKGWLIECKADFISIWVGIGTCGVKNSEYSNPIEHSDVVTQYVFKVQDIVDLARECLDGFKSVGARREYYENVCLLTKEQTDWQIRHVKEEHIESADSKRWANKNCLHENFTFSTDIDWLVNTLTAKKAFIRVIKFNYSESGDYTVAL